MNLITTSLTLVLVYLGISLTQIRIVALFASVFALGLFFHVATWLMVGMVMLPTFILPTLGTVCIGINLWASAPKFLGISSEENNLWLRNMFAKVVS